MGVRKRNTAERIKAERKEIAFAKLTNIPSSPRKMRLVADMVRGVEVYRALGILKFSNKEAAASPESWCGALSPTGKPRMRERPRTASCV